jgi:hypothetical protein
MRIMQGLAHLGISRCCVYSKTLEGNRRGEIRVIAIDSTHADGDVMLGSCSSYFHVRGRGLG